MTPHELNFLAIKGVISEMPAAEQEAVRELIDHIKRVGHVAGHDVFIVALSYLGAELAATT